MLLGERGSLASSHERLTGCALQGLTPEHSSLLKALHIKSIRELAESKYFMWAESIVTLAATEVLYDKPAKAL